MSAETKTASSPQFQDLPDPEPEGVEVQVAGECIFWTGVWRRSQACYCPREGGGI